MKRFESQKAYLVFMFILSVFIILPGCGGGEAGGGSWYKPIVTTTPTVSFTNPANNQTDVPILSKITAVFSGVMDPATINSTTFTVRQGATAVPGNVTYNGVTAVFTPTNLPLAPNTRFTGTITTGAKNVFGVPLLMDYTWSFTTGASADTTAPTVTDTIHDNGATNVTVNTKVGATFTEGMDPSTITNTNFTLKEKVSGTAVAGTVSYSGLSAVFSPSSHLAFDKGYIVTVKGGANGVKDLAGNPMANDFVISWTTGAAPDNTAPAVTDTIHDNGALNVPINTHVGATFSEWMDPSTINNVTFTVKETTSGTAVAGTLTYSGMNALFVPSSNLATGTRYTVTVKGGVNGVKDMAGNPMPNDFVISWTTIANAAAATDNTAPWVTGTVNANGAINVAVNTKVGATFSEWMDPSTINNVTFTFMESVSGNAVAGTVSYSGVNAVFTPLNTLASNTRYTATIKGGFRGAKDLAGNPLVSDYIWSWTTGAAADNTAPSVIGTINTNGQTNVAVNTKVGATFSEAMTPSTITNVNFALKETVSGNAVAGTVSYSGLNVVFTPLNNLAFNTQYTVTVKGGVNGVKDLAGNPLAADYVISWTTGAVLDNNAPTVTLVFPADLATGVAKNSSVVATFSKAMNPLSINTATFKLQASGPPLGSAIAGSVTYDQLTNIATFNPTSDLALNTKYTATITTGAKDLAGNSLFVNKIWSFTTAAAPIVTPSVSLGSVSTYGTFGGTAGMTNQGILTIINGNIGTIATTTSTVTGFHDTEGDIFTETGSNKGTVNGTIYTCTNSITGPNSTGVNAAYCALATQARLDAQAAYLALATMPSTGVLAGNLAGLTINPGVYTNSSSVLIEGGNLTLDALGDANAVFVFQIGSTLTLGGPGAAFPRSIILAGGAQAKNVFWQVGTFATINAGGGGTMMGTIIAQSGVSFSTAGNVALVTLNGRAISLGASVTMTNTVINVPAQ